MNVPMPNGGGIEATQRITTECPDVNVLALGYSNREIAGSLGISMKTVETHRSSGVGPLRLTGRTALVRLAIAEGWSGDV